MLLVKRARRKPERIASIRCKFRAAVLAFAATHRTRRMIQQNAIRDTLGMHAFSGAGSSRRPGSSIDV